MNRSACICVPARNEVDRLPRLLDALAAQDMPGVIQIALCINNSDDGSAEIARATASRHGARLRIAVDDISLPATLAHAGSARRHAMGMGIAILDQDKDALLLTTDADCRPPPDWLRSNLEAYRNGSEIIGGRIVIDEEEGLIGTAAIVRARWYRYWEEVRAIEDAIDPLPWDPAPRHGDHTGASLAMSLALYEACGGVPVIPLGEDRALVAAAIAAGGRLIHPITVWTNVSARRVGRAVGGMADDMERLHSRSEGPPMAPALDHWRTRATWRRALRGLPGGERRIAEQEPFLPPMPNDTALGAGF